MAHFFLEIIILDKGINFIRNAASRHTRVTELKIEQLTLLNDGIFTENICTFDNRKVEKGLTSYATLLHGYKSYGTKVGELTFSGQSDFSQRNTLHLSARLL